VSLECKALGGGLLQAFDIQTCLERLRLKEKERKETRVMARAMTKAMTRAMTRAMVKVIRARAAKARERRGSCTTTIFSCKPWAVSSCCGFCCRACEWALGIEVVCSTQLGRGEDMRSPR